MKTNSLFLTALLAMLVLDSCKKKNVEFQSTQNGLKYHFFKSDPGAKTGNLGDMYELNIHVLNSQDSLVFKQPNTFKRYRSFYDGDFQEGLSLLHVGDSVVFEFHTDSFFSTFGQSVPELLKNDERMKLHVGVLGIKSPMEHLIHMNELEIEDMERFIQRKGWEVTTDSTGIKYEIIKSNSEGESIEYGDSVNISYFYYTLDDRIIAQIKPNDKWTFEVGDPNNRVEGLSRLLTLIKTGEKVRALIPFSQAFGEDGLLPKVEPFTTIVMELEIHDKLEE